MKYGLVLLAATCCLAACSKETSTTVEESNAQLATRVSIFSSKENQKQWTLHADSVNFENNQYAQLKNPQLLLKQNGQDSATVTGQRGTFDYEKQLVSLDGNATLDSLTEKVHITAPELFYSVADDKIWSTARTVITRGTAKSIAKNGIETNSKLTKIVLKKHSTRLPNNPAELTRKPL